MKISVVAVLSMAAAPALAVNNYRVTCNHDIYDSYTDHTQTALQYFNTLFKYFCRDSGCVDYDAPALQGSGVVSGCKDCPAGWGPDVLGHCTTVPA